MKNLQFCLFCFIVLFGGFSATAFAKNWNTDNPKDVAELPVRRVPSTFPNVVTRIFQKCHDSNGKKYNRSLTSFFDNELFYASFGSIGNSSYVMYRGKRTSRNRFVIRVSEASSKWHDRVDWITYNISGPDLMEALLSKTVTGLHQHGSFWRECKLFIYHPDKVNFSPAVRAGELKMLSQTQEYTLKKMGKLGLNFGFKYDFEGAKNALLLEIDATLKNPTKELIPGALAEKRAKVSTNEKTGKKAEEAARLAAAEEEDRKKAEEAARLAAAKEEAKKKAEEAARLAAAEEEARKQTEAAAKVAAAKEAIRREAEEKKLLILKADKVPPEILAEVVEISGAKAKIIGKVTDGLPLSFARLNDGPLELDKLGSFSLDVYIPRDGKLISIIASDEAGNVANFDMRLERRKLTSSAGPKFAELNPVNRDAQRNDGAVALLVGIADYERTKARAAYADEDAKFFYDYATLKLGVPEDNILELMNENADLVELKIATKHWLKRMVSAGKSDIYIFFAGHGMASDDGKNMYLLPYDGAPELLKESAISRNELFADIRAADPRSVTVFFDTCYSGQSRGEDMLIAARPVLIKAIKKDIPDNFTLFSAAAGDQTAKPLEEVKHGMFSYFLMKGMEGEADKNQDNMITAQELHEYVKKNVMRQSSGSQTPELQGDADRVLVRFN